MELLARALEDNSSSIELKKRGLDITWATTPALRYAAVISAILCCVVSLADLRAHLARLDYPKIQVLAMRIILMIPIYAIFSALSLIFVSWRFFFETVRDTYESFVLYMFFMLMIAYCGGEGQLLRSLKRKRYKGVHLLPVCCLPMFTLDTDFYLRCKRWVLQCALIKPVCSFIAMVTAPSGAYVEGKFAVDNVYTYTCIIVNVSLTMALYYLVLFEVECEKELYYARTFLKFLCVKSIIFFSYWQSVVISLAGTAGILYLGATEHEQEYTNRVIQDLLMCFELLPVSFMHRAAFGREKLDEEMAAVPMYMKDETSGNSLRSNVDTALNVNDIIDDTLGTIFYRRGKLVDQENTDETEGNAAAGTGTSGVAGGGPASDGGALRAVDGATGNAEALARDPTMDELVQHAITTDYGVRVDGALHFDEDSDREERNQDTHFTDHDVMLHRSRHEEGGEEVRVDTDLLRSSQAHGTFTAPHAYCVVCGRFDREMVRRRNGYKCKQCVGTKSQSLLRVRQQEMNAPEEAGTASSTVERTTRRAWRSGATEVVIEDVVDSDVPSPPLQ